MIVYSRTWGRVTRIGAALAVLGLGLSLQPSAVKPALAQSTPTAQTMILSPVHGAARNFFQIQSLSPSVARSHVLRQMPLLPLRRGVRTHGGGIVPSSSPDMGQGGGGAPSILQKINGMEDSPSVCSYFGGCQPPDMAVASTPNYVLQGVNTSWALYSTNGELLQEVSAQDFFGAPNPKPAGCESTGVGPFLSDPRAFYDPNDGLIWAAELQVESAFGLDPNCDFVSRTWVANLNPATGAMEVYSFDTTLGQQNANDYTEFGFNATSVEFSMNMFTRDGSGFPYAETFSLNKHAMEAGASVTPVVFYNYTVGNIVLDTIQPVATETTVPNDPNVEYLVDTFNFNGDPNGNDCLNTPCSGFVQWTISNPGTKSASISGTIVPTTQTYEIPNNADQPGCSQCVETIDARITGTPVYSVSTGQPLITFGIDTNVQNKTQIVPGILWLQDNPVAAAEYQGGYVYFQGDRDASFPAFMPNNSGTLYMVFDTMSSRINPSIMIAKRGPKSKSGTFGPATFLQKGLYPTCDSRWGDYEAASYDGFSTNHVWVASEYAGPPNQICPSGGDWATTIAQIS